VAVEQSVPEQYARAYVSSGGLGSTVAQFWGPPSAGPASRYVGWVHVQSIRQPLPSVEQDWVYPPAQPGTEPHVVDCDTEVLPSDVEVEP
jgi:hypothetical protein